MVQVITEGYTPSPCFTFKPFCFKVPSQFTTPLKLRSLHFRFNALWQAAIFRLIPYFLWNIIFDLRLFYIRPLFQEYNQGVKKILHLLFTANSQDDTIQFSLSLLT